MQDIHIIGLEPDSILPIDGSTLYRYAFHLSAVPDPDWQVIYETSTDLQVYDSARIPSTLAGNTIIILMSADDDPQQQLDIQKRVVADINQQYALVRKQSEASQTAKAEISEAKQAELERLRAQARGLSFD